ncbi:MAG TPA: DUF1405 domain-containing protein [Bacilli bacterium]
MNKDLVPYLWSKPFLTSPGILWSLLGVNLLGTIYGYQWYYNQMVHTLTDMNPWLILWVPDSPTASLFFTLGLIYLLFDYYKGRNNVHYLNNRSFIRGLIEALAVVTSVKYGIWAVAMIVFGAIQGDQLNWQDWMLMTSHLGMAVEVLLFIRFFRLTALLIGIAAIWTICNDYIDYHSMVYPWLPDELEDDLVFIERFTLGLSLLSILLAYVLLRSKLSAGKKV